MPTKRWIVFALVVASLIPTAPPAGAASRRAPERIVFSRLGSDGYRLYSMRPDGSDLVRLTNGPGDDIQADVSRDGRIVFARGWGTFPRGPATRIYIRERNGRIRPLLEEFPGSPPMADYFPRWSPDGKRVAFTRANVGGELSPVETNSAVYVVNANGSRLRRLTPPDMTGFSDWSPDGRRIVFNGKPFGPYLYIVDVDARRPVRRRVSDGRDFQPSWSPDGRSIAFTSTRDGGGWQVYLMRSDGRNERRITRTDGHQDKNPAWSPDGRSIVFESTRDDSCPSAIGAACRMSRIYVMRSDGRGQKAITRGPADSYPVWYRER